MAKAEPFEIGGARISAGRRKVVDLPVARIPAGAELSVDVAVARGKHPGPTVWISGAIHGDELNGVEIVRRVWERIDPQALSGTLLAVPIVNVFGLLQSSRYLPDGRDLNRSFPGSKRGSLAARLANLFMSEIVSRCDLGIDFHTATNHRTNLPQIRADLDDPQTVEWATAFGTPVLVDARLRDGSLRQAATDRGIRVLLFEGGEANRFEPDVVKAGVDGALRLLQARGMLEDAPPRPRRAPKHVRRTSWLRARRGGILRLDVGVGQEVAAGEPIGSIADTFGRSTRVTPRTDGIVIGATLNPLVNQGDAVVNIGSL